LPICGSLKIENAFVTTDPADGVPDGAGVIEGLLDGVGPSDGKMEGSGDGGTVGAVVGDRDGTGGGVIVITRRGLRLLSREAKLIAWLDISWMPKVYEPPLFT
jgi:hypothetical protein